MRRVIALAASILLATGLAVAVGSGVASASPGDLCTTGSGGTPWVSFGAMGEMQVCYTEVYYSPVQQQYGGSAMTFQVAVHDWHDDGISIYAEYMLWGSSTWVSVPNSQDSYGGPAAVSSVVTSWNGLKFLRLREVGGGSFVYSFKPTTGAGSSNGCGLMGHPADSSPSLDGYTIPNCPAGSY